MTVLPWPVRPDLRLPALSLLPGLNAAQQARLSARPKRDRTVQYVAPFALADREADYRTAWAHFEQRHGAAA